MNTLIYCVAQRLLGLHFCICPHVGNLTKRFDSHKTSPVVVASAAFFFDVFIATTSTFAVYKLLLASLERSMIA